MSRISPAALTKEQLVDRWGALRAKAKKLEAEIEPLKEEFERRGLRVVAGETWGVRAIRERVRLARREGDPGRDGAGMVRQAGKAADAGVHQFRPRGGAVMAAYWSTLAYQSLFEPSHFFGRREEARAFDCGYCAEFLGALRTEDFARALAEGASEKLLRVLAFVTDEMRLLTGGRGLMPRKAKPTSGEACALHLRDLRREHARPPADIRPLASERFAGMTLLAVMRQAYERASYCSTAIAWLEPGRDELASRLLPSHTTVRTGPYTAVRLVKRFGP